MSFLKGRIIVMDQHTEWYPKQKYKTNKNNKNLKAEFSKQTLSAFYDSMNYIFREGVGTDSQKRKDLMGGIAELLFGKQQ